MPLIRGHKFDYDLIVIGGGSGGLAASKVSQLGDCHCQFANPTDWVLWDCCNCIVSYIFIGSRYSWQKSCTFGFCCAHSARNHLGYCFIYKFFNLNHFHSFITHLLGLGGTCVNVGCIPKKLMHHASLIGQEIEDAHFFGWQTKEGKPIGENLKHDWASLVTYVQNNIKGSNFGYKALLRNTKVNYINAFGSFIDAHTIKVCGF